MLDNQNVKDSNDDNPVSTNVTPPSLTHDVTTSNANFAETSYINWPSNFNSSTAVTGFYVFACLSAVIIVYFVIKAIR